MTPEQHAKRELEAAARIEAAAQKLRQMPGGTLEQAMTSAHDHKSLGPEPPKRDGIPVSWPSGASERYVAGLPARAAHQAAALNLEDYRCA